MRLTHDNDVTMTMKLMETRRLIDFLRLLALRRSEKHGHLNLPGESRAGKAATPRGSRLRARESEERNSALAVVGEGSEAL